MLKDNYSFKKTGVRLFTRRFSIVNLSRDSNGKCLARETRASCHVPPDTMRKSCDTLQDTHDRIHEPLNTMCQPHDTIPEPSETMHEPHDTMHESRDTMREPSDTSFATHDTIPEPRASCPKAHASYFKC